MASPRRITNQSLRSASSPRAEPGWKKTLAKAPPSEPTPDSVTVNSEALDDGRTAASPAQRRAATSDSDRRVRAHPAALKAFRGFQSRPVADRWAALCIVRGALLSVTPERAQVCLNALRLCLDDRQTISRGVYEDWRSGEPSPDEWPSAQAIVNTFESWMKAKNAAGATAFADILDGELGGSETMYTPEELVTCVAAYGRTGQPLRWPAYDAFATEQMTRADRELPRFFRNRDQYLTHFSSWAKLLIAAGLGERMAEEYGHRGIKAGTRDEYSREACLLWLRRAALKFGPTMTTRQYELFALKTEKAARRRGEHVVVPRRMVIRNRIGPWHEALLIAGVISEQESQARRTWATLFRSDQNLIDDLAESVGLLGAKITTHEHDLYRRFRMLQSPDHVLSSSGSLQGRFTNWSLAKERAIDHLAKNGRPEGELPERRDPGRLKLLREMNELTGGQE
jgi:hypothetical protein